MPGVKSARLKADKIKEMVRMISLHPNLTTKVLAGMFGVKPSTISLWKKKAGI